MENLRSPPIRFDEVPSQADFAHLERENLEFWDSQRLFEKSAQNRPADKRFVFYDGPPFASGLPHYGNLLAVTQTRRNTPHHRIDGPTCIGF